MTWIRSLFPASVILGLAAAIHADWHLARHHGRLSLGSPSHWLAAIPIFALAAWYIRRRRPALVLPASVASIAAAAVLAQVIEPLGEFAFYRWPLSQGFGRERLLAFAWFMGAGLAAYAAVNWTLGRRARQRGPKPSA